MMPPDQRLAGLIKAVDTRQRLKWLFFWGHTQASGGITKACMSQWYPSSFEVEGEEYATAEHWMMAEKARLFGDEQAQSRIMQASHPGEAKKFGREVRGFDDATWTAARYGIVVRGNVAKFSTHQGLRDFLVGTGERVLVEASPVDRIWGIGLAAVDPRAQSPNQWLGPNLLGFALMQARELLGAQ